MVSILVLLMAQSQPPDIVIERKRKPVPCVWEHKVGSRLRAVRRCGRQGADSDAKDEELAAQRNVDAVIMQDRLTHAARVQ